MKIAIIVNEETALRCTGSGCLKAFMNRKDAFEVYGQDVDLVGFMHLGGDFERKVNRMIDNGVDAVHLSSCVRSKHPEYESIAEKLSAHFDVIGYTHGNPHGKTQMTVRYKNGQKLDKD